MTCTYPQCETTTTPGIHLCAPHQGQFVALLDRAGEQVATARETVAKQGSNTSGGGGGGSVSSAPVNLTAMVLVDEYVRLIEADPRRTGPEPTVERVRVLARSSSAGPTLAHLERAEARMMAVCERPADWLILGDCAGTTEDGEPCPGQYRYLTGDTVARCKRCPYEVAVDEYRRWQLRGVPFAPARLTDVVRGLAALGVVVRLNTVKSWAHRGRLVPASFHGAVPLYRAGDVLDLLEQKPVAA
ncbi:hypothetical protein [Galactobacter valiniphilus]|uniref:hypothetical protein n=1 Tax=Galactobacter valiniphilus TaxID=2676122 RepID=UPI003736076C